MKKTLKILWKIIYYTQLTLFILTCILGLFILLKPDTIVDTLAHMVVKQDNIKKADVIVVIGGAESRLRTEYGIDLLTKDYAPHIIFSGLGEKDYAQKLLDKNGIDQTQYMFEPTATTTFENAHNLVQYVNDHHIHSILLVSSPVQSRRARFMFKKVFPDVEIIGTFSPNSMYDPDKVFLDKPIREQLNNEAIKFFYYHIKYAFY